MKIQIAVAFLLGWFTFSLFILCVFSKIFSELLKMLDALREVLEFLLEGENEKIKKDL